MERSNNKVQNNNEIDRGKLYFDILSKYTVQMNWLFLAILIFAGANMFILYRWHAGDIRWAINREKSNREKINVLYDKFKLSNDSASRSFESISELDSNIDEYIKDLEDLDNEGNYFTVPFIGISLFQFDYIIALLVIGLIFFIWYHRLLRFCRDVLKEYFNFPKHLNETYSELISSLFFFIFPSAQKHKRYRQTELGLGIYIFSIFAVLFFDICDLCIEQRYQLPLYKQPGFIENLAPYLVTESIVVTCLILSFVYYLKLLGHLKDIRNLSVLVKWYRRALIPAIDNLFRTHNRKIKTNTNLIEYKKVNNTGDLYLVITIVEIDKGNEKIHSVAGRVNLPESLKKYFLKQSWTSYESSEFDVELKRRLTVEEIDLRTYFKAILTEDTYETELYKSWLNETGIKNIVINDN